jgi:hypothetical protein
LADFLTVVSDELEVARFVESFTRFAELDEPIAAAFAELDSSRLSDDEKVQIGVIDDEENAHIVSSDDELGYKGVSFFSTGTALFTDALVAGIIMLSSGTNGAFAFGTFPEANAEQVAKRASISRNLKGMGLKLRIMSLVIGQWSLVINNHAEGVKIKLLTNY